MAPTAGALSAAVDALSASAAALEQLAQGAVARCLAFTAGVELSELLAPLDSALRQGIERLSTRIRALADGVTGVSEGQSSSGAAAATSVDLDQDTLQQLLRLPLVCSAVRASVVRVDTDIRTGAAALAPLALAAKGGKAAEVQAAAAGVVSDTLVDMLVWRLSNAAVAQKLDALQRAVAGVVLPHAFAALDGVDDLVERSLLGALCAPALRPLREVRSHWHAARCDSLRIE
jgi:hypothetical protein